VKEMAEYGILGAGAMGTALSFLISSNNYDVLVWARRKEVADAINKKRVNMEYMPRLVLPEKVKATTDIKKCLQSSDNIVFAIPSHSVVRLCEKLKDFQVSKKLWLSVIKGMDSSSKRTVSQILQDELKIDKVKIVVLSGPNFAIEIVENVPTVGVLGCKLFRTASSFEKALTTEHFVVKITDDLKGVEIGGILKNVGAIAVGLVDGLNLGDNTRGFVFSRYLEEALEIGTKIFGAKEETLLGPACLGDMITTAFSLKSRNRIIGLLASKHITNIPKDTFIAEGRNNAKIVRTLAHKNKIKAPITDFVDSVLTGTKPVVAFNSLWKKIKKETKLKA
jgi:glycerol-3-phosphate dehydrogenase (NAD(P)+)